MRVPHAARSWHALTAVVVISALLLQFVLVLDGASVLVAEDPPGLGTRVFRFLCYFTIQSNLLVAVATSRLAMRPGGSAVDGALFRAVRLAAVAGITITALVHFVLLRPLLDLHGWSAVADTGLHQVVPALAVAGWLGFGPRPRVDARAIGAVLAWALVWLAFTLVAGQVSGWVPYPFLDNREHGWWAVAGTCLAILALTLALLAGLRYLDRRLPPAPTLGP